MTADDRCSHIVHEASGMGEVTASLISVIIPVYNAERYLRRAIDSVLAQTYYNIEIILMDDGSTDTSAAICREYADRDDRCRYFRQDNSGPDIARREGFLRSRGQSIIFVDADDHISPDMAEKLYGFMTSYEADVVCCASVKTDDTGRTWEDTVPVREVTDYSDKASRFDAFFTNKTIQGSYWAKLIRREVMEEYPFVEDSLIGEDITAALYMLRKAARVVAIPDVCYYYHHNMGSISHARYTRRHAVSLDNYIRVRDEILAEHYIDDAPVCGFFAERQMAVATAMSRGHVFDKAVAAVLRKDLKSHWKDIRRNTYTPLYMKMCILMYIVAPRIFHLAYMIVYALTGR